MGLGMMVDHSVVVVENLQRRFRIEGRAVDAESAILFTHELSTSNVGSTLTSVVVFIPVLLLPGVLGALFTDLALAVIFSQVASFLTSITLVPLLFLLASRRGGRNGREGRRHIALSSVSRGVLGRPRASFSAGRSSWPRPSSPSPSSESFAFMPCRSSSSPTWTRARSMSR